MRKMVRNTGELLFYNLISIRGVSVNCILSDVYLRRYVDFVLKISLSLPLCKKGFLYMII